MLNTVAARVSVHRPGHAADLLESSLKSHLLRFKAATGIVKMASTLELIIRLLGVRLSLTRRTVVKPIRKQVVTVLMVNSVLGATAISRANSISVLVQLHERVGCTIRQHVQVGLGVRQIRSHARLRGSGQVGARRERVRRLLHERTAARGTRALVKDWRQH